MVEEIRKIVEIAKDSSIKEMHIKTKNAKVLVKFSSGDSYIVPQAFLTQGEPTEKPQSEAETPQEIKRVEVKSSRVGILRLNDKKGNPISTQNKRVSKGELLCNIEVLGTLHEVTSPCNGVITKILLGEGDIVEYGSLIMEISSE